MHNRLSRFIAPPSVLLVCALTGCCSTRSLDEPQCPGDAIIRVDKDANVNKKEVTLDKRCHDVAYWVSDERDQKLFIEFKDNAPFEQMVQVESGRWRVQCADWTCSSQDIKADATGHYKYWQILKAKDGKEKKVDGMIIIKP